MLSRVSLQAARIGRLTGSKHPIYAPDYWPPPAHNVQAGRAAGFDATSCSPCSKLLIPLASKASTPRDLPLHFADASCLCAGRRGIRHRCVIPQPLPIPLPYPRIFAPSVLRHGDVASAVQQPAALVNQPWNTPAAPPAAPPPQQQVLLAP